MSHSARGQADRREDAPDGLIEDTNRFFSQRARLGLRLINAGIAAVFVGWIVVHPGELPLLSIIQALNFLVVGVALWYLRDPRRRRFNHAVVFAAYAATIVATGAVGIVAGDSTTPLLILVGMAMGAAVLVPWQPSWQLAGVALSVATASWTVGAIPSSERLFWLKNVGAIAPTLIGTIYLSHVLGRQRAAAARAAVERRSREASLADANRRLEQEVEKHRKTEDALRLAVRELDHRVKNTLALVQSIADQTLRSSTGMNEFREAFAGRIQALARIHAALAGGRWEGLALAELVSLVVGPYRHHADSVRVDCDSSFVPAELVRVLGMTLHELATNAAKYGALSTDTGRVTIAARVEGGDPGRLRISWDERGGPSVSPPTRRGFGMRLIDEAVMHEVDGRVSVSFPADGLRCDLDLPIRPAA